MTDNKDITCGPQPPNPEDCCGLGCNPCVYDLYERDRKRWLQRLDNETPIDSVIDPDVWSYFELINVIPVQGNCLLCTFGLPDGQSLGVRIGKHLVMKQEIDGKEIVRPYTPISDPEVKGYFEVVIRIYPHGKMSNLIKEWKVGDKIPWRGPFGAFTYSANSFKYVIMFSSGTGITPLYQIIRSIIENENEESRVRLLYSAKFYNEILLRDELYKYLSYWNFFSCFYLSEETKCVGEFGEEIIPGRISRNDILAQFDNKSLQSLLVLVCGSRSYENDIIACVLDANVPSENIVKF